MFDLFEKIAKITTNTVVKKIEEIPKELLVYISFINIYENGTIKFSKSPDRGSSITIDLSRWDGQNIRNLRAVVYESIIGEESELVREMTEEETKEFEKL